MIFSRPLKKLVVIPPRRLCFRLDGGIWTQLI